jgi:hypothetical protein
MLIVKFVKKFSWNSSNFEGIISTALKVLNAFHQIPIGRSLMEMLSMHIVNFFRPPSSLENKSSTG